MFNYTIHVTSPTVISNLEILCKCHFLKKYMDNIDKKDDFQTLINYTLAKIKMNLTNMTLMLVNIWANKNFFPGDAIPLSAILLIVSLQSFVKGAILVLEGR